MTLKPRQAFVLANGADTGGCAVRTANAFAAHAASPRRSGHAPSPSTWTVRSMVTNPSNYIQYPQDLIFNSTRLARYYDEADVVVLNSTLYGHTRYDDAQGKPTVLIHHGKHEGHFAQSIYEAIIEAQEIGAVQIGTTVDLELLAPPNIITWVPTPVDTSALLALRKRLYQPKRSNAANSTNAANPSGSPLLIGHFPTDRKVKSTEIVIEATRRLKQAGYPAELLLIENTSNAEVLRIKATDIDILVDQLVLGYGVNAIEAWAMGIPVVGGIADPKVRAHAISRYDLHPLSPTGLPFFEAHPDADSLFDALRMLVSSPGPREMWSTIGRVHALRWHSYAAHVRLMTEVLERTAHLPTALGPLRRPKDGGRHLSAPRNQPSLGGP